jgi:peroxiredoxin (alkyl hydroperoxide reductase subunit C)
MPAIVSSYRPNNNNNNNNNNNSQLSSNSQMIENQIQHQSQISRANCEAQLQYPAPHWSAQAVEGENNRILSLENFRNEYVVMFFYPSNFLALCQSELIALSKAASQLSKFNCKVVAISTDSEHSHHAITKLSAAQGGIGSVNFPMVSDSDHEISSRYGVLLPSGISMR